jgi:hypothetical protein
MRTVPTLGFVSAGFVSAGFVSAGFVSAGFVSAVEGFVETSCLFVLLLKFSF